MSDTLDEWEEEARHYCDKSIAWIADEFPTTEAQERILTLIDLVMKKDDALRQIVSYAETDPIVGRMDTGWACYKDSKKALALTENLLEKSKP